MAYNVLDGTVDYSTTQHNELLDADGTQEIRGTKVIIGNLVDRHGRAIVPPAITELEGGTKNAVITYHEKTTAKAHAALTFDGKTLATKRVHAEAFEGDGSNLRNLPPNAFNGKINAQFLNIGPGLKEVRNALQVDVGPGLCTQEQQVEVALLSKGGLSLKDRRLSADPKNCTSINTEGQSLSDNDVLMIHDVSHNAVRNTTLSNLYTTYINAKIPQSAGPVNSIQLKGRKGFMAGPNLTYDPVSNVLKVEGTVLADKLIVSGHSRLEGTTVQNIKVITAASYEVASGDYTLLCDTSDGSITLVLPPACNHRGRVVVAKKIEKEKYNLKSHSLVVKVEEGEIDFQPQIELKMTYSTLTLQSDGEKWWIIGKSGS